jgi:hypothetical protein
MLQKGVWVLSEIENIVKVNTVVHTAFYSPDVQPYSGPLANA